MTKYRVKHLRGIGYFAQVKPGFFWRWRTIGKHMHGFGLYEENYIDHPLKTRVEAISRISDYKAWDRWVNHKSRKEDLEYIE